MLKSDAEKMKSLVHILKNNEFSLEEKEAALEELQFFVEQRENAVDLYHPTIDGLGYILQALQSPFRGIRWRAAWILATMLQNNTNCQKTYTRSKRSGYIIGISSF